MTEHQAIEQAPTIADLLKRERAINERIEATIRRTYPVGSLVLYSGFTYSVQARVVRHDYGGFLKLRNVNTGRDRRVDGRSSDLSVIREAPRAEATSRGLQIEPIGNSIEQEW